MAIYTKLNKSEIAQILMRFPALPHTSFTAKGIALGTVNTYDRITYKSGAVYYLKIDEVANESRLANEIRIFDNLIKFQNRLTHATPAPLFSDTGLRYISFQHKFALVIPELAGISYFKHDLTHARLERVGKAVAEWHSVPVDPKIPEHRFSLAGQKKVFQQISSELKKRHPDLHKMIQRKLAELAKTDLPKQNSVLIHADLFPENILWQKTKLSAILDFDAAGLGDAFFDIAVCIHALCHDGNKFSQSKIQALLRGYFGLKTLSRTQKSHLNHALELTTLRFLLTRLRDVELSPMGRKAKPFKDYREFARRLQHPLTKPYL